MDPKRRAKIIHSTQDHLAVRDIMDDLVITKCNAVSLVIRTSSVNFDLLSEEEQVNKIMAFAGLLNSLSFPLQILIKTNRIDITKYIDYLKKETQRAMSTGLKKQLSIYTTFIQNLIIQHEVLDKKFYLIITQHTVGEITNPLALAKSQKNNTSANKQSLIDRTKPKLVFKRDHIIKQLSRMGLTGQQLNTEQLIDLFYDVYNPQKEDLK
jgi:hypothetical protein